VQFKPKSKPEPEALKAEQAHTISAALAATRPREKPTRTAKSAACPRNMPFFPAAAELALPQQQTPAGWR
jgi:hypothetical protein